MPFQAVLARQLAALTEQLTAAAAEDLESLSAQIADLTTARDRYRTRAEELTKANDALSFELEARAAESEAAASALRNLESERERSSRLAGELASIESRHADLQRQHSQLEEMSAALRQGASRRDSERAASDAALIEASAGRDRERAAREAIEAELARLRGQNTDAKSEFEAQLAQLRQELADVRQQSAQELANVRHEAEADAARLREEVAQARVQAEGEAERLREELTIARSSNRERLVARLGQLFEDIGHGASVEDVLSAAANGLAEDFGRVAVFAAKEGRLEPRYQRGFDPDSGFGQIVPSLGDGSLLARAAASDELGFITADGSTELPFTGSPSVIVTAPVKVRGELLALIYADNDGRHTSMESTDTPARVADIVRRHTALRLDRLTIELKTMGELRAYARMLLDEVDYVYRADVSARKPDAERLERLTENLRCARQIYQQRVAVEGPAMAVIIEEVIAAAVAAKAGTPFGRELASVAPQAHPLAMEVAS